MAVGARSEQSVEIDLEDLKLSNLRTWPSSFRSDEVEVIKSLARLKLTSVVAMVSDSSSLVNRSLDHDYQRKYQEVLSTLLNEQSAFSKTDLDKILKFQISRMQGASDIVHEQEQTQQAETRKREDEIVPLDPSLLKLSDTREIEGLKDRVYFDGSTSQVLNDGRLLLRSDKHPIIYDPRTNAIEELPWGNHFRVMPDGKSILIFKVDVWTRQWNQKIFDLQTNSFLDPINTDMDERSDFAVSFIDISPSGEKLAVTLNGLRILILEVKTGKIL